MSALRVGISGCGGITPWTFEQLGRNAGLFDVVAVQDPDPARGAAIAARFHVAARHAEFSALCEDDLDLVILNGPNDVHRRQVEHAVERGLPCLVQKPLAPTVADAEAMVRAANAVDVALGVVMMERGDPVHHEVRAMLRDGFIGEPVLIESVLAHGAYLRDPLPADDWRRDPARVGGGAFCQLAVHGLNLVGWLLDRDVGDVVAMRGRGLTAFDEETSIAVVRYGAHILATFAASWATDAARLAISGTAGAIVLDVDRVLLRGCRAHAGPILRYDTPDSEVAIDRASIGATVDARRSALEVHAAFARFLRGVGDNPCTAEDALADLRIIEAVRGSG